MTARRRGGRGRSVNADLLFGNMMPGQLVSPLLAKAHAFGSEPMCGFPSGIRHPASRPSVLRILQVSPGTHCQLRTLARERSCVANVA